MYYLTGDLGYPGALAISVISICITGLIVYFTPGKDK